MPTIDLGLLITGTNRATSGLRGAGSDLDNLNTQVKKVGESSQETANRLKAIEVVIGGIILEKSIELTKAFVEMASKVQNVDVHMAAWAGGVENADKIMRGFNASVGAAGIDMDVLSQAFVKLRAAGVSVEDAQKTVTNLVNGIAAVGGDNLAGKLEGAATSFQRFAAKGVVSTRELNAIVSSTGLTVEELAAKIGKNGVSISQFYDQLKDKTLNAQQLLNAFNAAATEKFGDFASLLSNTISGSLSKFSADMDEAFGHLGGQGVNVQLVAFIQNLDKAVVDFISHISAADIANFFQLFANAAPTIAQVGNLIVLVGKALLTVADAAFRFANLLPGDAVEFGILGYVLLGKKGAVLLALIGAITGGVAKFGEQVKSIAAQYNSLPETDDGLGGSKYQTLLDRLNKQNPDSPVTNMFSAIGIAAYAAAGNIDNDLLPSIKKLTDKGKDLFGGFGQGDKSNFISKLFGTPEQMAAIQAGLDKLAQVKVGSTGLSDAPVNSALEGKLAALRQETDNLISKTAGSDKLLQLNTAGDELGQKLQSITNQTSQWNDALSLAAVKIASSKLPLEEKIQYEKALGDLQKQINTDTDAAIAQARVLNDLKQAQLDTQLKIASGQVAETARQLALTSAQQGDNQLSALSGTQGGQVGLQVLQQRAQLQQTILGYESQINAYETKAATDTANADKYRAAEDQVKRLMEQTQTFADSLNEDLVLQNKFFQELGNTLENDISSGISGLIQGTQSWGDVGRKVFGDLIDMSVKYLIQLAEMKLLTMALGAFQDGGVIPGGVQPFAKGGVPGLSNQITPFANGGLTSGPTLFGLAGEAGTEAIMPLTRIGGKLGVHATGGGGGNAYHITVQAIDTETGMQFIAKHISSIQAGLGQNQKLNRRG